MSADGNSRSFRHKKPRRSSFDSKNAINSRLHRQKQKEYVRSLQEQIAAKTSERDALIQQQKEKETKVEQLTAEVNLLQSINANSNQISSIVTAIKGASALASTSQSDALLDPQDEQHAASCESMQISQVPHSTVGPSTATRSPISGVCLHVSDGNISFESCRICSAFGKIATSRLKK